MGNGKMKRSIKIKVLNLVNLSLLVTIIALLIISVPKVKKNINDITMNYMNGLAEVAGSNLDNLITMDSAEFALSAETLQEEVGSVKVEGMESSYLYVVGPDGTMLYHPTAEKIGQPVENEAVKKVLAEMDKGKRPTTEVITYDFKGVEKYASFFVGKNMDFVLIVTADSKDAFAEFNKVITTILVMSVILLLIAEAVTVYVARRITDPIVAVTKEIEQLADLDFTSTGLVAMTTKKDETGLMAKAIEQLREILSETMGDIQNQSSVLREASIAMSRATDETRTTIEQVEKAVEEVANGATYQAQETQEATENIIQMGNMIENTGEEVERLRDNARTMRSAGEQAMEILETLAETNQRTKNAISVISEQTMKTNESALEIKTATDIISDIAEETNLLSLNASIEAARAGETGRGFAVVAAQIQKLAEQSNSSATMIKNIIDSLIADSEKSVASMEEVNEIIEKQDEDVQKTQKAFCDVEEGIQTSIASIRVIAEKTEYLEELRGEIVEKVQGLTAIAEENAAITEENSASAAEITAIMSEMTDNTNRLNNIADGLGSDVERFNI